MAKQIIEIVSCDFHAARDEHVLENVGQYDVALRVPGGRFRFMTVDLCEVCAKQLTDVFAQVADVGRTFEGKEPVTNGKSQEPEADRTCPTCGKVLKNRQTMATHVRAMHGQTLAEAMGLVTRAEFICPDCGDAFTAPQGLSAHRRIRHGRTVAKKAPTTRKPRKSSGASAARE